MKGTGALTLADGHVYPGELLGSSSVQGEVVFFTGMTGYQEVLTDPSYRGQIIVFTYPLIGQYGISEQDSESRQIQVSGVVVQTLANNGLRSDLADWLAASDIPVLTQVDTRALVHHLRNQGDQIGTITNDASPVQKQSNLIATVSTKQPEIYPTDYEAGHIVCLDYGVKKSMIEALQNRQMKVTVVPFDTPKSVIDELKPDGLLFSNGPGNPSQLDHLIPEIKRTGTCLSDARHLYGASTDCQSLRMSNRKATPRSPRGKSSRPSVENRTCLHDITKSWLCRSS